MTIPLIVLAGQRNANSLHQVPFWRDIVGERQRYKLVPVACPGNSLGQNSRKPDWYPVMYGHGDTGNRVLDDVADVYGLV